MWYNSEGRRLGWGSLDAADFKSIMTDLHSQRWQIDHGEKFIVVSAGQVEGEYLRRHHPNYSRLGDQTVLEVGPEYLVGEATFVVSHQGFYIVMRVGAPGGELKYPGGIAFQAVGPRLFTNLILAVSV